MSFIFTAGFKESKIIVEGTLTRDGQAHLPLESQVARVAPLEDGYDVNIATQWPAEVQASIAQILGIPVNKLVWLKSLFYKKAQIDLTYLYLPHM